MKVTFRSVVKCDSYVFSDSESTSETEAEEIYTGPILFLMRKPRQREATETA